MGAERIRKEWGYWRDRVYRETTVIWGHWEEVVW